MNKFYLENSKITSRRPSNMVGHTGKVSKTIQKSLKFPLPTRKNGQGCHAQLFYVRYK